MTAVYTVKEANTEFVHTSGQLMGARFAARHHSKTTSNDVYVYEQDGDANASMVACYRNGHNLFDGDPPVSGGSPELDEPAVACFDCMDTGTTGWNTLCTCGILGSTYAIRASKSGAWLRHGNIGFTRQDAAIKWGTDYANDYGVSVTIHHGTDAQPILTVEPGGTVICECCGTLDSFCICGA